MPITSTEHKRRRVARVLGSSFPRTKMFEDHSPAIQKELASITEREQLGVPLAVFFEFTNRWAMLTTTHLVWSHDGPHQSLPYAQIARTKLSSEHMELISKDPSYKMKLETIEVVSLDGKVSEVYLEPDEPLYKFWRALNLFFRTGLGATESDEGGNED